VNKVLDTKGREWYTQAKDLEAKLKTKIEDLKALKKELKVKQKTLGTYEYLMRLPAEQEQQVIKCKQCPKFFMSRDYLKRHYTRNHPGVDFTKEWPEGSDERGSQVEEIKGRQDELQKTVNQRLIEMSKQMEDEKDAKARQQEELFNKIKNELFSSLSENFRRVESELTNLKLSRSTYED
jgi:patatin-like phospholipase/acyl hydrolase